MSYWILKRLEQTWEFEPIASAESLMLMLLGADVAAHNMLYLLSLALFRTVHTG